MLSNDELMKTARAYAECSMNETKTGMALFISQCAVNYRLKAICERFGKNPKNFYELAELLEVNHDTGNNQ